MTDRLRGRFDDFRAESIAHTVPLGVTKVRRRVARHHATRAVALVVAATAIAVGAWIPGQQGRGAPATSPTMLPTEPSATSSNDLTPLTSGPTGPGASAPVTSTRAPSSPHTRPSHTCNSFVNVPTSSLLSGGDPNVLTLSSELIAQCPDVRLHIVRATYVGFGSKTANRLALYASYSRTLTADDPTTMMTDGVTPSGSCYAYLIVTLVAGGSLPHTIRDPIPELSASGSDASLARYWTERGFGLVSSSWGEPTCD